MDHPRVLKNISQESGTDLKVIFSVLFGHKRIRIADVKKSIKKWNGWEVKKNSTEHHKLEENAANVSDKKILLVDGRDRNIARPFIRGGLKMGSFSE